MVNILDPDKDNSFTRLVKFKESEIFVESWSGDPKPQPFPMKS